MVERFADAEKHAAPAVGSALAQLAAAARGVLRRSYYQGWTTAQIAHDLHIPKAP
jgi:DNA-directed RNA polymerase specialized sigma24 family protein